MSKFSGRRSAVYAKELSNIVEITEDYVITSDDNIILCDGTITVTLPPADGLAGKKYYIKNIGTGVVTIDGYGTETIDDGLTAVLECQYEGLTLTSNGTEWFIL